eukprot:10528968-Heterocapsa_arctica.AAC.1
MAPSLSSAEPSDLRTKTRDGFQGVTHGALEESKLCDSRGIIVETLLLCESLFDKARETGVLNGKGRNRDIVSR